MIAFDLDDTLLRDDLTISDETVEILQTLARRGVAIIPASGRAPESMKPFVDRMGCARFSIASNGAETLDQHFSHIDQKFLPAETTLGILAFAEQHACYAQTYTGTDFHYNRTSPWAERYAASSMLHPVFEENLPEYVERHPTNKILLIDDPQKIEQMYQEATKQFGDLCAVTTSKPEYLELNPPHTSKGNALMQVAKACSVPSQEILVFGDGINDLSMFSVAGISVAMGNANDMVKQMATEVCKTNQEDGVTDFLKTHPELFPKEVTE